MINKLCTAGRLRFVRTRGGFRLFWAEDVEKLAAERAKIKEGLNEALETFNRMRVRSGGKDHKLVDVRRDAADPERLKITLAKPLRPKAAARAR
jgi:hypothetical protein